MMKLCDVIELCMTICLYSGMSHESCDILTYILYMLCPKP